MLSNTDSQIGPYSRRSDELPSMRETRASSNCCRDFLRTAPSHLSVCSPLRRGSENFPRVATVIRLGFPLRALVGLLRNPQQNDFRELSWHVVLYELPVLGEGHHSRTSRMMLPLKVPIGIVCNLSQRSSLEKCHTRDGQAREKDSTA
jgi:hypothetical protein